MSPAFYFAGRLVDRAEGCKIYRIDKNKLYPIDNHNLYPTAEAMAKLYTLKPLPRDAERARTRAWTKIKSGT